MQNGSSRSRILGLIKSALQSQNETTGDAEIERGIYFTREAGTDVEIFERSFQRLQGTSFRCKNIESLESCLNKIPPVLLDKRWCCSVLDFRHILQHSSIRLVDEIIQADVALTDCECLVARTGSVVLSAGQHSGRALPVYAPVHITIAKESQLVYDTEDAFAFLLEKYGEQLPSSLHFVAGPSRSGDIEKTLVMGVHGPKDVYVFLLGE